MLRPHLVSLNQSNKFIYKPPSASVDHLIIGAGVVGLAIARKLVEKFPLKTTYVLERNPQAGSETSSRSSEVIHAGFYYPVKSLKTKLCLQGRAHLYNHCQSRGIPHKKIGKLVVGRAKHEGYLESLHTHAMGLGPLRPVTHILTGDRARELEPDLSPSIACALHSPDTGIVDSHALMESFESDILDSSCGELVYSTRVVRVDPYQPLVASSLTQDGTQDGWVVQIRTDQKDQEGAETDAIHTRILINSSGLSGTQVLNSLLPPSASIPMYYARGSYMSYRGPGVQGVKRLLYPVPEGSNGNHSHAGLGTHLTLDIGGNIRFGPSVEWIEPTAEDEAEGNGDFWQKYLNPASTPEGIKAMHDAVADYLPNISLMGLTPDYAGIRPKLVGSGANFEDFHVRVDYSSQFLGKGAGGNGKMISLLGIESPGLTSSMALAEMVAEEINKM